MNNNSTSKQQTPLSFQQLLQQRLSRRQLLKGGLGFAISAAFSGTVLAHNKLDKLTKDSLTVPRPHVLSAPHSIFATLRFQPIAAALLQDKVIVPQGYTATVLYPWGEPIKQGVAEFKYDASNSAAEQALQAGMHHDGMSFFPLPKGSTHSSKDLSTQGLLVINHEYIDASLLHKAGGFRDNPEAYSREKTDKEIAAHGASIIEIKYINHV